MTAKKRNPVPGVVVYKRGNKWAYRVELERDSLTNARQWEYQSGFATEDEAWGAGMKAKSDHKRGLRVVPSKRTLADFMTEWMAAIQDTVKSSTYVNYSDYQEAYVLPVIGKKPLQQVDVPLLNALYRHLLTAGRCKPDSNTLMYEYWETRTRAGHDPKPKEIVAHCGVSIYAAQRAVQRYRAGRLPVAKSAGLAPKTVKNVHRMLHRALADAVAWRYLEYNPAEHTSLPRESRKGTRNRGMTWTPEELAAWPGRLQSR